MTNETSQEMNFLENASKTYRTHISAQNKKMKELIIRTFSPFIKNDDVVAELGCDDGYITKMLAPIVKELDVIDGSKTFLEKTSNVIKNEGITNVNFVYSLFEEINEDKKYDCVFATYILEHVNDPVDILKKISRILKKDGLLFIVVPNANAISRQLAVSMNILGDLKELTDNDIDHGHRRVYDRVCINRDINSAGFDIIAQGGLMFKLLADFQMDKLIELDIIGEEQLEGLYKLGFEYPDLAGSLFAVCRKK
jgi:ubiquinone/menaquinone biosynthesis C-methylase UbiE